MKIIKRSLKIFFTLLFFMVCATLSAQIAITNEMSHYDVSFPGQTVYGSIKIQNIGTKNERVSLYQKDYLYHADGSNIFGNPGLDARSNAKWVALSQNEVLIAPDKEVEIPYSIKIPSDATLKGAYWSLVMVQSVTNSVLNPDKPPENSLGVQTGTRFGVQIITAIGDTGEGKITFSNPKIIHDDDTYGLQVDLENSGDRFLKAGIYVDLYSANGDYQGRFVGEKRSLLPGTSVRSSIMFPKKEAGRYKAQVVADCGGNDLFGVMYSLTFK